MNNPLSHGIIIASLSWLIGMTGCATSTGNGQSELLSDGYISFFNGNASITFHDSLISVDPAYNELFGSFADSTLSITGGLQSGTGATFTITHCLDTGVYVLSVSNNASEHSYLSADVYASYETDSLHGGEFHLTRFDTVTGRIAGTFEFTARRYNGNENDTAIISNGVVFDFPIAH
jgi:hypothetical protein